MSRPALSALRALEIIDLMAGQPSEKFTLSDIVRLTGTNAASCHAVLAVLLQSGYLLRDPERKTYRLAPLIIAIGEAAARHDPLYGQARRVTHEAAERTGLETVLSARAGLDIVGVARFATVDTAPTSLRVGQRVPLRAPLGGLFVAWDELGEQALWCASDGDETPAPIRKAHEAALDILRTREFLLTLRSPEHGAFTRQLRTLHDGQPDLRLAMLLRAMDNGLYQPQEIVAGEDYLAQVLAVPIFDRHGRAIYNVSINYPPTPTSGATLIAQARDLVDACRQVSAWDLTTPVKVSR